MRKLLPLVLLALAVPFAVAQEIPNPLAGAQTIYIHASPAVRHELRNAIASELPSVRFVSKASEADLVLELRTQLTPTGPQTNPQAVVVQLDRYNRVRSGTEIGRPVVIRPSLERRPTSVADGMTGVAIRGDVTLVVYHGVSGPFTASYFAREFVKAYREANC